MGVKIVQPGPRQSSAKAGARRSMGLGDAVEVIAKPVARVLGIEDCAPCLQRKAQLNAISDRASARIRGLFRRRS